MALQNTSRNPVAFLSSPPCQFGESPGKKSPGRNEETFDRINFMPNFTFEGCGRNVASRFSHQRRKEEIPKAPKNSVLPPKVPRPRYCISIQTVARIQTENDLWKMLKSRSPLTESLHFKTIQNLDANINIRTFVLVVAKK